MTESEIQEMQRRNVRSRYIRVTNGGVGRRARPAAATKITETKANETSHCSQQDEREAEQAF